LAPRHHHLAAKADERNGPAALAPADREKNDGIVPEAMESESHPFVLVVAKVLRRRPDRDLDRRRTGNRCSGDAGRRDGPRRGRWRQPASEA